MRKKIVATSPEGREFVLTLEEREFKDNLNRAGLTHAEETKSAGDGTGANPPGIPEEVQIAVVQGDLKQAVALLEKDGYKVDVSDLSQPKSQATTSAEK